MLLFNDFEILMISHIHIITKSVNKVLHKTCTIHELWLVNARVWIRKSEHGKNIPSKVGWNLCCTFSFIIAYEKNIMVSVYLNTVIQTLGTLLDVRTAKKHSLVYYCSVYRFELAWLRCPGFDLLNRSLIGSLSFYGKTAHFVNVLRLTALHLPLFYAFLGSRNILRVWITVSKHGNPFDIS